MSPPSLRGTPGSRVAVIAALAAIASQTLVPSADSGSSLPPWCLICDDFALTDILANVVLFLPLGLALAWLGTARRTALAVGFLTTLAIELLQMAVIPGRDASVRDLIANTAGAALGHLLGVTWRAWALPRPPSARRLAAAALMGWLLLRLGGVWLAAPHHPDAPYFGQWAPRQRGVPRFTGTVHSASVLGEALPPMELARPAALRERLEREGMLLRVRATAGPTPRAESPIVRLVDDQQNELAALAQDGDAIVGNVRRRASLLKLRSPGLRIEGVLAPGDTVAASVGLRGDSLRVTANGQSRVVALRPSLLWSSLLPLPIPLDGGLARAISLVWSALLLYPLGYLARRGGVRAVSAGGIAGLLAVAAGMTLPGFTGTTGIAPSAEWLAASIGITLGWWSVPRGGIVRDAPAARTRSVA